MRVAVVADDECHAPAAVAGGLRPGDPGGEHHGKDDRGKCAVPARHGSAPSHPVSVALKVFSLPRERHGRHGACRRKPREAPEGIETAAHDAGAHASFPESVEGGAGGGALRP
jgi:hypothetical protein